MVFTANERGTKSWTYAYTPTTFLGCLQGMLAELSGHLEDQFSINLMSMIGPGCEETSSKMSKRANVDNSYYGSLRREDARRVKVVLKLLELHNAKATRRLLRKTR